MRIKEIAQRPVRLGHTVLLYSGIQDAAPNPRWLNWLFFINPLGKGYVEAEEIDEIGGGADLRLMHHP